MGSFSSKQKGSTEKSEVSPWATQVPYLEDVFAGAKNNFQNADRNYYSGETVAQYSPESQQGIDNLMNRATNGNPVNDANSDYAQSVLNGDWLNSNKHLDGMFDHAAGAVTRATNEVYNPATDSKFAGAGRYGSDLWLNSRDQNNDTMQRNLGGMASDIYGGNYANERSNMQQMSQLAPNIANQDYVDIGNQLTAGNMRDEKNQQNLDADFNKWQYETDSEDKRLQQYLNLVGGQYGQTTNKSGSPASSDGSLAGKIIGTGAKLYGAKLSGGG